MKSFARKYEEIRRKHPFWSSYICFAEVVTGKGFSTRMITHWFNKLVDKDDYNPPEKKSIIANLVNLTKRPEDSMFREQIAPNRRDSVINQ
jgi:hypothetical protein